MTHSPEPWRKGEYDDIVDRDGVSIIFGYNGDLAFRTEEDCDRVLACVNACAGIPTENLETVCRMALCQTKGDEINAYIFGETPMRPPTPKMLADFLELTWGVKTKVELL